MGKGQDEVRVKGQGKGQRDESLRASWSPHITLSRNQCPRDGGWGCLVVAQITLRVFPKCVRFETSAG